ALFPAAQPDQSQAYQDQDLQRTRQPHEPDCPRPRSRQAWQGKVCVGFGQSLPQSLTSVAPACRFKKRIIASVRLFTQPGPEASFAASQGHVASLKNVSSNPWRE